MKFPDMRLNDEEQSMRAGQFGPAVQWAIEHQIKVGRYLGAEDFVEVSQAHIMADTESLGVAGVEWLEGWAEVAAGQGCVRICQSTSRPAKTATTEVYRPIISTQSAGE